MDALIELHADLYRPLTGKPYGGRSRVAHYEHEVDAWILQRVRARTGRPAWAPPPPPAHPKLIPVSETSRRTGFTNKHLLDLERRQLFPERVRITPN
jgi:predicted DNA-binding transcriptional regulator AlpA